MRRIVILTILLCAACGAATPEVVYVTAPAVAVGPAELERYAAAATDTQAAIFAQLTQDARQAAQATAVEQSARATSTSAWLGTQDALQAKETSSALQLTAGAGQALATNAAAVHTADADQTAAAATPTAAALRVLVAATGTELARQAQTDVRRQEIDDQVAAAWRWALLFVGAAFLLGLAVALVFGISDLLSARAALVQAQAAKAQAEAMQMWIMQYGGVLLQLHAGQWERMETAQIAAPAAPVEPVATNIHEVPYRAKGEVISTLPVGEPETPERLKVIHLLMQAVAIEGPLAKAIPSATALGMHPQDWQDAVNLLKAGEGRVGYVVTSPGRPKAGAVGRTRLIQPAYTTLGALLEGVRRGDALPRPAPPAPVANAKSASNITSE